MRKLALLIVVAMNAPDGLAQQSPVSGVESKIVALERAWKIQGYGTKDLRTLDALLDPAFASVSQRGQILSKAELLRRVQSRQSWRCTIEDANIRIHADTVIVTARYTQRYIQDGKLIVERGRWVDSWQQRNGRWIALASISVVPEDVR